MISKYRDEFMPNQPPNLIDMCDPDTDAFKMIIRQI